MSDNRLKRLVRELHRRSIWQVMGIYVAASWVVFEVVQTLTEGLGLPGWFPGFAFVLLLIGLPIVLATAFVQEGGPGGSSEVDPAELDEIFTTEEHAREPDGSPGGASSLFTWRNAILGGVAAFALWGVVAAGWVVFQRTAGESDPGPLLASDETRPAVAVLPFENLSTSEENEYFAHGMHEAVLTNLARVGDLTVLSRTSVMSYEDTDKNLRTIAEELGATAVVEGSVQRADGQVRVTAQLIDPRNDAHLWADSYDRSLDDVFAVQSEVARKVTEALEATLSPAEERRIARRPTGSMSAYDLYLKGRQAYQRHTAASNEEAIRLYRRAVAADSSFALAWAGLANAYGLQTSSYGQGRSWADSAEAIARKAVGLDPELGEAYKALGLAHSAQGEIRRALRQYRRAVELNPNHYGAINNIGVAYSSLGHIDRAVSWQRRAHRLSPGQIIPLTNLALNHLYVGDTTTAADWLQRAEGLHPDHPNTIHAGAALLLAHGRPDRAFEKALALKEHHPENPRAWAQAARFALFAEEFESASHLARGSLQRHSEPAIRYYKPVRSVLGYAKLRVGEDEEGRTELRAVLDRAQRALDRGAEYPHIPWQMGTVHAALGNRDEALRWLARGHEAGYRWFIYVRFDPMLEGLRDTPGFEQLMTDMRADLDSMRLRMEEEGGDVDRVKVTPSGTGPDHD